MSQPTIEAYDPEEIREQLIDAMQRMALDFVVRLEELSGTERPDRIEVQINNYAVRDQSKGVRGRGRGRSRGRSAPFAFPTVSVVQVRQIGKVLHERAERCGATTERRLRNEAGFVPDPQLMATRAALAARLFRVVEVLLEALRSQVVITKREVYYRDVALFGSQRIVDRLLEQLALSLGVDRDALGVIASPRALVSGEFRFALPAAAGTGLGQRDEAVARAGTQRLVPVAHRGRLEIVTEAEWLLVVEKEASFRTLCDEQARDPCSCLRRGIVVTAKGYSDCATSAFIASLVEQYPGMPVFALVDSDSFGIDIWRAYQRNLSASLPHSTRKIELLGVQIPDFRDRLVCDRVGPGGEPSEVFRRGLVALSASERTKAIRLLRSLARPGSEVFGYLSEEQRDGMRDHLSQMLLLGYKAEIQWLSENVAEHPGGNGRHRLVQYVVDRIHRAVRAHGGMTC